MDHVTTVQEVSKERRALSLKPAKDYQKLLKRLGEYLRDTLPSELDFQIIKEVEVILRELYDKINAEGNQPEEVSEAILDSLAYAGSLSIVINHKGPFNPPFFKNAILLGKLLVRLSRFLK